MIYRSYLFSMSDKEVRMFKWIMTIFFLMGFMVSATGCLLHPPQDHLSSIERHLSNFEATLASKQWDNVRTFFSEDYFQGIEELRDRLEQRWVREHLLSLEFIVGRVLEKDALTNVQVRWHKTSIDVLGKVKKLTGNSELIFVREGKELEFLSIKGDDFF